MSGNAPPFGPLAFVANGPFEPAAMLDGELLETLHGREVLVVPTGSAFERPARLVEEAVRGFAAAGVRASECSVLRRADAEDASLAAALEAASAVVLLGSSPLHIRSVLKDSLAVAAMLAAWHNGATVIGIAGGAEVLTDPMVDPRGGAFTVGLGFLRDLAVVPDFVGEDDAQFRRTLALAPRGVALVALETGAAVVRSSDGTWRRSGSGAAHVYAGGEVVGLEALAGKAAG